MHVIQTYTETIILGLAINTFQPQHGLSKHTWHCGAGTIHWFPIRYVIAWLWAGFLVSKNLLPISFCHFDHVICLLMERTAHKLGETELYNCVSSAKLWHCDDWHCCPKGTFIKEIEEGPECFLEKLYNEYQVFTTFSRAATELWVVTNFVLINWCYSKESTPEVCQKKRKIWYGVSNVQDRLLIILVWSFLFPGKGTGCWI